MARYDTTIFCDFDGTITTEETFVGTLMRLCEEKDLYDAARWALQIVTEGASLQ